LPGLFFDPEDVSHMFLQADGSLSRRNLLLWHNKMNLILSGVYFLFVENDPPKFPHAFLFLLL
jgi:hypothetical protein